MTVDLHNLSILLALIVVTIDVFLVFLNKTFLAHPPWNKIESFTLALLKARGPLGPLRYWFFIRVQNHKRSRDNKKLESEILTTEPYQDFLFAMSSPVTRERYSTRLRSFFVFIGIEGTTMEERCRRFVQKVKEVGDENCNSELIVSNPGDIPVTLSLIKQVYEKS